MRRLWGRIWLCFLRCGTTATVFPMTWRLWKGIQRTRTACLSILLKSWAAELEMAIAVTYLEKYKPLPRNTVTVFDRHGRNVLTYAKVHTCDFDIEKNLTPGDEFYVTELDTENGKVNIGAMICYDREFPESARILMLKGAGNHSLFPTPARWR